MAFLCLLSIVLLVTVTQRVESNDISPFCDAENHCDPLVVSPGKILNENARFPISLEGDWEKVLVAPDVTIIPGTENVFWTEGPLVRSEVLYVSDPVHALIYRISTAEDSDYTFEIWATHSGGIDKSLPENENLAEPGSNGMATDVLDPEFVVINQQGLRRVVRCRLDNHKAGAPLSECPDLEVITDSFGSSHYNSPNDVVVHPDDGSIWFTDPIYGLLEKNRFCDELSCSTGESYLDAKSEIGWQGVYRVDRKHNNFVELVTKCHRRPNGLGFTPDGTKLWVADSTIGIPSWTAYDIREPWVCCDDNRKNQKASSVVNPASLGTFLGRTENPLTGGEGLSDGFKFDEQGYLWTSIPNGFAVIDTAKQEVICQILLGTNTSNLAFGKNGDVWLTGLKGIWKIKRRITLEANPGKSEQC